MRALLRFSVVRSGAVPGPRPERRRGGIYWRRMREVRRCSFSVRPDLTRKIGVACEACERLSSRTASAGGCRRVMLFVGALNRKGIRPRRIIRMTQSSRLRRRRLARLADVATIVSTRSTYSGHSVASNGGTATFRCQSRDGLRPVLRLLVAKMLPLRRRFAASPRHAPASAIGVVTGVEAPAAFGREWFVSHLLG